MAKIILTVRTVNITVVTVTTVIIKVTSVSSYATIVYYNATIVYHLVFITVKVVKQLQQWWRDNDDPNPLWHTGITFGSGFGYPSLIQSNLGNKGNFEVVVPYGKQLQHWWRDNDDPRY